MMGALSRVQAICLEPAGSYRDFRKQQQPTRRRLASNPGQAEGGLPIKENQIRAYG